MLITISGKSGSGKTFISDYLCSLDDNIVHLNIDIVGHKVLESENIIQCLVEKFNLKLVDGKIDRVILGDIVFNNRDKMQSLKEITWGEMQKNIDIFIYKNNGKIIILDYILMPLTKYFKISDINILVKSDFDIRMKRATKRDGIDSLKFNDREKATIDYNEDDFNYIISNYDIVKTKKEVEKIYESIISRQF